ncbi:MAG: chemotaxis protein MotB [Peptococcaceae bacterium BRH_c4a]|nr:MAG: chemotaxis protein MotB [Peptococcaceae bacterium BRH_c4a]
MKRRHREKKGGHERWLITYADMITLLLIFFIVMYTLSRIDVKKFQALSTSLTKAMGSGSLMLDSPGPSVVPGLAGTETPMQALEITQLENVKKEMEKYIKEAGLQAKVTVTMEERGVVLSFQDEVLFKLGQAELTPRAREIIRKVGPILVTVPNYLRVEGHTDNLPINTHQYPSNWELSSARSNNVLQELVKNFDIYPQRLSAVAYGEYRPLVKNDSDAHRQLNRRVNIVVLRSKFGLAEPGSMTVIE